MIELVKTAHGVATEEMINHAKLMFVCRFSPMFEDGKRPLLYGDGAILEWLSKPHFIEDIPKLYTLCQKNGTPSAIGAYMGKNSDYAVGLEFDNHPEMGINAAAIFAKWLRMAEIVIGKKDLSRLLIIESPTPSPRVIFRVVPDDWAMIDARTRMLSHVPAKDDQGKDVKKEVVSLKGDGGHGKLTVWGKHQKGDYKKVQGTWDDVPVFSGKQAKELIHLAETIAGTPNNTKQPDRPEFTHSTILDTREKEIRLGWFRADVQKKSGQSKPGRRMMGLGLAMRGYELGLDAKDIDPEIEAWARGCNPPLSTGEVRGILSWAPKQAVSVRPVREFRDNSKITPIRPEARVIPAGHEEIQVVEPSENQSIVPMSRTTEQLYYDYHDLNLLPLVEFIDLGLLLPKRGLAFLIGEPGCGKSWEGVNIAMIAACVFGIKTVYVAGEDIEDFYGRTRAWAKERGLEPARGNLIFRRMGVNFLDPVATELFAEEMLKEMPGLIIMDTMARMIPGSDEKTGDISTFCDRCEDLRRFLDCLVLAIHHTAIGGTRPRGAGNSDGAANIIYFVTRDLTKLTIECTKVRSSKPIEKRYHEMVDIEWAERRGEQLIQFQSKVLRPIQEFAEPKSNEATKKKTSRQRQLLIMLAHPQYVFPGATVSQIRDHVEAYKTVTTKTFDRDIAEMLSPEKGWIMQRNPSKVDPYVITDSGLAEVGRIKQAAAYDEPYE